MVIETGCYGIRLELVETPDGLSGTISSELCEFDDSSEYRGACDGIESLILAHACAGIDVTTPAYLEGIETAVEAAFNKLA